MKNNLRRILNSIINHKKDSLLIFGLVFILASFVMIYWLFYFSCSTLVSSINDKTTISAILKEGALNGKDESSLNSIFSENKISLNDSVFNLYKDYYSKVLDDVTKLNDDENVLKSSIAIKSSFKIFQNVDSLVKTSVVGFDEEGFNDDGYTLIMGNFPSKDNEIIVDEDFFVYEDEHNYYLDVGCFAYMKNSKGDIREYEVVGIYKKDSDSNSFNENMLYSNVEVMMSNTEIIDFAYMDDCLGISSIILKIRGLDYSNKLVNELKRSLNVIKIGNDNNFIYPEFALEVDDTIANELIAPVRSMKNLFQVIAVIMIVIMMILLCNFMFYIVNKRRKELAIFMALGEKRIEVIRKFLLEVVVIYTISFILACPFSYLIGKNISNDMLKSNLSMQNRIATIANGEDAKEISSISEEVTNEYNLSLGALDYLLVYASCGILIVLSSSLAINSLCRIKLKELLK